MYLLLCKVLYPPVLLLHLLSQPHSNHVQLERPSILSLHCCPHPLQSDQQLLSARPPVGDIVQTLLH